MRPVGTFPCKKDGPYACLCRGPSCMSTSLVFDPLKDLKGLGAPQTSKSPDPLEPLANLGSFVMRVVVE